MALLPLIALFALQCAGHDWVEELNVLENGFAAGLPGFARNNGTGFLYPTACLLINTAVARQGDLDVDVFMTYTLLGATVGSFAPLG
jgi:hypothetical protein